MGRKKRTYTVDSGLTAIIPRGRPPAIITKHRKTALLQVTERLPELVDCVYAYINDLNEPPYQRAQIAMQVLSKLIPTQSVVAMMHQTQDAGAMGSLTDAELVERVEQIVQQYRAAGAGR